MIIKTPYEKGLYRDSGEDIQYFGKDALDAPVGNFKEDIRKYLGKNCFIDREGGIEGIIIGLEISNSFVDYYYIVYSPDKDKVYYELCNNAEFTKTIK